MEKLELERLVAEKYTISKLAEHFGKGKSTVRHWLNKYDLKTLGKAGAKPQRTEISGHKVCTVCGINKPIGSFRVRTDRKNARQPHCIDCDTARTVHRQQDIKRFCVAYKGNKCADCGYDDLTNLGVFEFHHIEPEHKDFNIGDVKNKNFQSVLTELDKCALLCANCHVKRHLEMKIEEGYTNNIDGNSERFRAIREQKLDHACNGDVKCSECGYDECSSTLIISYQPHDKKYCKFNRKTENWPDDFKRALTDAEILCKICHRSRR